MDTIKFTTNWNNKLGCTAFTTFRIHNDQKYQEGKRVMIECKNEIPFMAEIITKHIITLNQVNDFMAYVDTGYDRINFIKMVRTMYKNKVDVDKVVWDFILLKRVI